MKKLFLMAALLLSSCAREAWRAPMVVPTDSTALLLPLPAGKYKFTGPVTFTLATAPGAVATSTTADNRKAGQKGGAAATAPDATATAITKRQVPGWVFALIAVGGLAVGVWLRGKIFF